MLERNAASAEIPQLVTAGAAMHPREAVQHLVQAVLEATDGELNDDATVMCLDWHGGRPREHTTDSGTND
jgi:Stage II sporulation protein E (SpoIIE)